MDISPGCQEYMKKVISASRRTDLIASFPDWLSSVLEREKVLVRGPRGHPYTVDLKPSAVHSFVLWSKNFTNLIENRYGLLDQLAKYDQLYFHFTVTGLGGSFIERGAPLPGEALLQLERLLDIAGRPERVSLRFDPVLYWVEGKELRTNLLFFEKITPLLSEKKITAVRFSFAQWYGKAVRRANKHGLVFVDPPPEKKREDALYLASTARKTGLNLYSCCQKILEDLEGIQPSACIDGRLLTRLHPGKEKASTGKDKGQRPDCCCTDSSDIGSYSQSCPHSCLYCYANPGI
jgi:hypothetical protein